MLVNVLDKAYIRCGLCQSIFPEVFRLPDTGECARTDEAEVPTAFQVDARAGADICPTGTIVVRHG